MATNLDSLFASSTQEASGIGKDETGTVTIQSSDSQPVQIQTSGSATAIQVNDDATVQLNLGISVNEIVNAFNAGTPDQDKKLATVAAIRAYAEGISAGIQQFNFNSLADFNAYTWQESEMPAQVYVSDITPFNYTDDYGKSVTNVDWVFLFLHWEVSVTESHLLSSSADSNQLTATDIKALYESNINTNAFTDAYKTQLDNAPVNINNSFTTTNNNVSTNASNISTLQSGKADKGVTNVFTSQNGFDNTSSAQLYTKNATTGGLSAIGHKDKGTGNFRAGTGYDDANDVFFVKVGNQSSFENLANRLEVSVTNADFKVNLQENGNDVLTTADYSTIKTGLDNLADTNFLTDSERSKITNCPSNTNTELSGKLSLTGGTLTGLVNANGGVSIKRDDTCILFRNASNEQTFHIEHSGATKEDLNFVETGVSANRLVLEKGGQVGIGVASPTAKLDVNGTIKQSGNSVLDTSDVTTNIANTAGKVPTAQTVKAYVDANSGSFNGGTVSNDINLSDCDLNFDSGHYLGRYKATHSNQGAQTFDYGSNIGTSFTGMRIHSTWDGSQYNEEEIAFHTHDGGVSQAERVRIDKIGNVGIGVDPTQKLDVAGTVKATGLDINGNSDISGTSYSTKASIGAGSGSSSHQLCVGNVSNGVFTDSDGFNIVQHKASTEALKLMSQGDVSVHIDTNGNDSNKKFSVISNTTSLTGTELMRIEETGNMYVDGDVNVGSWLKMKDSSNVNHNFEKRTNGIALRAETNPAVEGAIFIVESSGNSQRLRVEHDGAVTTSNAEIRVNTASDGTGGTPVLTPENIGVYVASYTYSDSLPPLSETDIATWFRQMAHVQFVGVGSGTINLPEIVAPNTLNVASDQVIAGSTITLTNYNSSSNIILNRWNSGQKFMIDNVANISTTSQALLSSSKIELQALDLRNYASVGAFCWALRGI